jgi:hypothetical protein
MFQQPLEEWDLGIRIQRQGRDPIDSLGQRPREIGRLKSLALKARFIAMIAQVETDEDESLL